MTSNLDIFGAANELINPFPHARDGVVHPPAWVGWWRTGMRSK